MEQHLVAMEIIQLCIEKWYSVKIDYNEGSMDTELEITESNWPVVYYNKKWGLSEYVLHDVRKIFNW